MTTVITDQVRRRMTAALFLSQSLFAAATIAGFTLTPIIAAELGGSDQAAGLPATLVQVGWAAAAYPAGWLMDRLGRRKGLSAGLLTGAAGMALSALAVVIGSFAAFLAGAILVGMARAASQQGRYVAAEIQPPAQRARAIGVIVFAGTLGAVGGPLLVAPAEQLALRLEMAGGAGPFLLATLFFLAGLVILMLFLRPDPLQVSRALAGAAEAGQQAARIVLPRSINQIFTEGTVRLALLALIVGQVVMTMLMVITPLHMSHHEHTTQAISWVIMAHTLGMFGLSGVTGWLIDHYGRRLIILAGGFLLVAAALLAPVSTILPVLAPALFLLGLGWNFCFVAGSSLLSEALTTEERGRAQGASETLVAVAAGLGSLVSGPVFDLGGMAVVSALGLAGAGLLIAATLWSWRRQPLVAPLPTGQD